MATWTLRPKRPRTTDDHEPHLPHEEPSTQLLGVGVTLALGAVFVVGTLYLFA